MADAVVIGAGHNGLVAANLLADAGWEVLVLEATGVAGGSVRTAELTAPGFRNDVFSAFLPSGRPHRSCVGWSWSATAWSGCTPPWRSPTPTPMAAARCCPAT
jgi:phytoene dehydrogenase-like protein